MVYFSSKQKAMWLRDATGEVKQLKLGLRYLELCGFLSKSQVSRVLLTLKQLGFWPMDAAHEVETIAFNCLRGKFNFNAYKSVDDYNAQFGQ